MEQKLLYSWFNYTFTEKQAVEEWNVSSKFRVVGWLKF